MQETLKFGSLILSTPANGIDGYVMTKHDLTKLDYIERAIPGTSGRIKIITGKGQSEQSSLRVEFECLNGFGSAVEMVNFLEDIESRITDARNPLDTVYYGILNESSLFTEDNCDMQFELLEEPYVVQDAALPYRLKFRVTFSKWGD